MHDHDSRPTAATLASVQRVIALAPLLGVCNPQAVPIVARVMVHLIGPAPPTGGVPRPAKATRAARTGPTRRAA